MPLNSISAKTLIKGNSISLLSCSRPSSLRRFSKGLCKAQLMQLQWQFVAYLNHLVSLGQVVRLKFPVCLNLITAYSCRRSLSKYELREGLRRYAAISVSIMIFGVGKSNASRDRISFFSPWPIIPASRRRNCLNSSEIPSSSR